MSSDACRVVSKVGRVLDGSTILVHGRAKFLDKDFQSCDRRPEARKRKTLRCRYSTSSGLNSTSQKPPATHALRTRISLTCRNGQTASAESPRPSGNARLLLPPLDTSSASLRFVEKPCSVPQAKLHLLVQKGENLGAKRITRV